MPMPDNRIDIDSLDCSLGQRVNIVLRDRILD